MHVEQPPHGRLHPFNQFRVRAIHRVHEADVVVLAVVPAENRLVFLTLNTMWKDPEYAGVRKKWEATVERMRARR